MTAIRAALLLVVALAATAAAETERTPQQWLAWFAANFDDAKWGPNPRRGYMRAEEDTGWRIRLRTLRALVAAGKPAVEPLVAALSSEHVPTRILAAQALGFLAPQVPLESLVKALVDPVPAVRLYAVDALGMHGGDITPLLESRLANERNRDVRKHIGYARERAGQAIAPAVARALAGFDPKKAGTARIGETAPDFELTGLDGRRFRLSALKGKQAVVLVFLYGDT